MEREAEHPHPFSTAVRNAWNHTSTPPCVFRCGLIEGQRERYIFTLLVNNCYCVFIRVLGACGVYSCMGKQYNSSIHT
jgi:hypothetical protein